MIQIAVAQAVAAQAAIHHHQVAQTQVHQSQRMIIGTKVKGFANSSSLSISLM